MSKSKRLMHLMFSICIACGSPIPQVAPPSSTPPPRVPTFLSACIGSEPHAPVVATALGEALRRGFAEQMRAILETAADRARGDAVMRSAATAAETIRVLGPTGTSLLILAKTRGIREALEPGDPANCACSAIYLKAAADRGEDTSGIVGTECHQ